MPQVTQMLRRAVQLNGRGLATECAGRKRIWAEVRDRCAKLAGALAGLGFQRGDRIAILALNSDRYLEYYFACAWGGFVFVPINTRLAPPEIAHWLTDSGATGLFIDEAFLPALPAFRDKTALRHIIFCGDAATPDGMWGHDALAAAGPAIDDAGARGDTVAGLFYTGGTTGRSKGVMLSHGNLLANAVNGMTMLSFNTNSVILHAAPMFHIADATVTLFGTIAGATHVFMARFDPAAYLAMVPRHRITGGLCVPTMINMLVNHPDVATTDLSSFREMVFGASPMPEAVLRRALQAFPNTRFTQAYGQTEAAPVMTLMPPEMLALDGPKVGRLRAAGIATPACDVQILDAEDREVPRGTVGEICGRGPNVMLGYWNQPELSAHTLRNGWLHTGDGGWMDDDGLVYVVDRVKDMIISGGENVYSAEVEEALYAHPAVAECAVIGVPDATWGERVHAIVRLKAGMAATEQALMDHCRTLIAGFKCPRSLALREEPLPLSGAGKILKSDLRAPFWAGVTRQVN